MRVFLYETAKIRWRLEVSPSEPRVCPLPFAKSWVRHCLRTCRSFFALNRYFRRIDLSFCTSLIDITEVNFCNTVVLLWAIEDQSHQVGNEEKRVGTTDLSNRS